MPHLLIPLLALPAIVAAQTEAPDSASSLRLRINTGLADQVYLLGKASSAVLAGRAAEAGAAREAARQEAEALAGALRPRLDSARQKRLEQTWEPHLAAQYSYAEARALPDQRASLQAAGVMLHIGGDLGALLDSLGLARPGDRLSYRIQLQDIAFKKGVDSLARGNPGFWYRVLRLLGGSAATIGDPLAARLGGRAGESRAAQSLRIRLNRVLREHVHLALAATGAALGGRDVEFKAAANALDENSVDLAGAIGSVYGKEAGDQFLELWRTHIGFLVDYTLARAQHDSTQAAAAVTSLTGYAIDFGQFLNQANPALKVEPLRELVMTHILGLKGAIDAQAGGDWAFAFTREREATDHMQNIADPVTDAIAGQFPEKFGRR